MKLNPAALKDGDDISATWSSSTDLTTSSWLGYYCSDNLNSLEDTQYVDYRYLTSAEAADSGGSFTQSINSARSYTCEFRFFSSR